MNRGIIQPISKELVYPMFQKEKPLFNKITKPKNNMFPSGI